MTTPSERKIYQEIWDGCGEHLMEIHPSYRADYLVPLLIRLIAKEREEKEVLRARIRNDLYK